MAIGGDLGVGELAPFEPVRAVPVDYRNAVHRYMPDPVSREAGHKCPIPRMFTH